VSPTTPNVRRAWIDDALCAQTDPEIFFPSKGAPGKAAKRVCRACPVRSECLAEAVENQVSWGVWGGLGTRERIRRLERGSTERRPPDEAA
jgi:WhiB family redox-sensing transcriptional regulator